MRTMKILAVASALGLGSWAYAQGGAQQQPQAQQGTGARGPQKWGSPGAAAAKQGGAGQQGGMMNGQQGEAGQQGGMMNGQQGGAGQQGGMMNGGTGAGGEQGMMNGQAGGQPGTMNGQQHGMMGSAQQGSEEQQESGAQGHHQAHAKSEAHAKNGIRSVRGTVESVQGDTLTLKNRLGKTHEFALSSQTKFKEHGRSIQRDQVKQGDEVRAVYRKSKGQLHATEILLEGGQQASGGSSRSTQGSGSGASSQGSGTGNGGSGSASGSAGSSGSSGATGNAGAGSSGTGSSSGPR